MASSVSFSLLQNAFAYQPAFSNKPIYALSYIGFAKLKHMLINLNWTWEVHASCN